MAIELPSVPPAPAPLTSTSIRGREPDGSFDERWAAWQAKGAAPDRVVRRTVTIDAPIVMIVAAVVLHLLPRS